MFELYAQRLIDLARACLQDRLRDKAEPNKLLQSVLRSFLRRASSGQVGLSDWNSLWTIPVVVTLRKSGKSIQPRPSDQQSCVALEDINREPLAEEANRLVETLEEVQRGFDEEDRQVVVLSLQGLRPPEISAELQLTERRVYRVLERVRRRMQQLRDAE